MAINLLFFCLFLLLQCSYSWAKPCHDLLRELASFQKDFVYCATTKAVPVNLCIGCEPDFSNFVVQYDLLLKNCTKDYFDHDRINIISTMQSILSGLWSKANCDNCFASNHWQIFDDYAMELEHCLSDKENKGKECEKCLRHYTDLNNYYIYNLTLDQNDKKICYDIQDRMNTTRSHWSKDLKCCYRERDMILFLCISIIISGLPFLFYISLFIYGKRRENVHDVLNNEAAETTSRATNPLPAASHIRIETADIPNNRSKSSPNKEKLQKSLPPNTDEDETDEDGTDEDEDRLNKVIRKVDDAPPKHLLYFT